ncbi:hypothetical protein SNEBB_006972 [Seison nebaliae]|nr:hypothetical protein SNEBB_006972 [Seison nebaliae]
MPSTTEETEIWDKLVKMAVKGKETSYSPYSKFRVGAAILVENEKGEKKFFYGCNVENTSIGLSICAERTAIVKAVSEGYRLLHRVAVATDVKDAITPCGSCRQFIREFGKDIDICFTGESGKLRKFTTINDLLPFSFTPEHLLNKNM